MEKCYKKFFEVGNNVYYSTSFNGVNYIGIESLLIGKSPIFGKTKKLTQGFKLLEVSPSIGILFHSVYTSKPTQVDDEFPDMNRYGIPEEKDITKLIKETYEGVKLNEIESLKEWHLKQLELCKNDDEIKEIEEHYKTTLEQLESVDMFKNISIDVKDMEKRCPVLTSLRVNGLKFLYLEKFTSLYDVVYMYEVDTFGTITIYRIDVVKGKIKGMESFMINKAILNAYYDYLYKNRKN